MNSEVDKNKNTIGTKQKGALALLVATPFFAPKTSCVILGVAGAKLYYDQNFRDYVLRSWVDTTNSVGGYILDKVGKGVDMLIDSGCSAGNLIMSSATSSFNVFRSYASEYWYGGKSEQNEEELYYDAIDDSAYEEVENTEQRVSTFFDTISSYFGLSSQGREI